MGRILKITGIVVGILILVGVIAIVTIMSLIDPNNYKPQISAAVANKTGGNVSIHDIRWSFFPHLGLRLKQVIVANPPGFEQQPFTLVGELDISVRILSLLRRHVDIEKIRLQDATFNLLRNQQGKANWENFSSSSDNSTTPTASTLYNSSKGKNFSLSLSNLAINNATVNWRDQQTGQSITLKQLKLNLSSFAANRSFPIELEFMLLANSKQGSEQLQLSAKSDVQLMWHQDLYALKNLNLTGEWFGANYPNGKLPFRLTADVILKTHPQELDINNLFVHVANLPLTGDIALQQFSPNSMVAHGEFSITTFKPRQFMTAIGKNIRFANENVMQNAAFAGTFQWAKNTLHLNKLQAKLDDMQLNGGMTITHENETININSDLAFDQLYPERYMLVATPPTATSTATATSTPAPSENPQVAATDTQQHSAVAALLTIPKGLNIAGGLHIGQFRLKNINLTHVSMQYSLQRDLLKLAPITADFYQGKSLMQFTADTRGATPEITLDNTLTNIQIGALLKDLANNPKTQITGTANITSHLQTQGQNEDAWLNSLNGNMSFSVVNGTLTNVDMGKHIYDALQIFIKHGAPTEAQTNQTNFSSLTGTLQIEHGVASNDNLLLTSASLQVSGKGTADLRHQQLDYHLELTALGSPFGSDVLNAQQKLGGHIPVKVSGTFSDPKVVPDLQKAAESAAKGELKEQVQKVLGKDVNETLKKLGNFLGQ
jgi:AsmA protein